MGAIDVGPGATDRGSNASSGATMLCLDNSANASGTLTKVEIWAYQDISGCKVGTFYGSGTSWTCRDAATIGSVTAGTKQTFNVSLAIQTGDIMGVFWSAGAFERDLSGGGGLRYVAADQVTAANNFNTTHWEDDDALSIYATGRTSGAVPIMMWG